MQSITTDSPPAFPHETDRLIALIAIFLACAPASRAIPAPEVEEPRHIARDVELASSTGTIEGTLLLPDPRVATRTVAVIVSGSGPTDRDGNSAALPGKNNSLLQIAEALAEQGIATLRYDKLGVGASTPN